MSLPLIDYRTRIDESSDLWIEIEAASLGIDKAAVGRMIFRDWAKNKAHAYKLATKRLRAKGIQTELFGDDEEDEGSKGSGRR